MSAGKTLIALVLVPMLFGLLWQANAAENENKFDSVVNEAMKELQRGRKLSVEKAARSYTNTTGKILGLSPCNMTVTGNDVTVEMTTDLYAGAGEPNSVLFIQYLFCINNSTGQLILKQADSILLDPGVGVCGWPTAQLNDLDSGSYTVVGRVNTRNADESETIKDEKSCEFRVE